MAMIYPVLARVFSPLFILLLLFSSHLLFNKHNSCLALRYVDERDNFNWDTLIDREISANQKELDYLTSLNRQVQESNSVKQSHDNTNVKLKQSLESDANVPWSADTANSYLGQLISDEVADGSTQRQRRNDTLFLVIVGTCTIVGIVGLIAAAIFWYKIQKRAEAALDTEYPSYGVTAPSNKGGKISPSATISDRKLAQSAQMFHYQQQRQQMMAQEKAHLDAKPVHSDESDDETPAGGDYTVYECPGLAPTGEMEVRNPLFAGPDATLPAPTSVSHPTTNNHYPQLSTTTTATTQDK